MLGWREWPGCPVGAGHCDGGGHPAVSGTPALLAWHPAGPAAPGKGLR